MKSRVLFFAEGATAAHVVRPLVLAQALSQQGVEVVLAVPDEFMPLIRRSGIPPQLQIASLRCQSSADFLSRTRRGTRLFTEELLLNYVTADRALIREVRPDLVVGDLRLSLSTSARLESVPSATLCNAYWSPFFDHSQLPVPVYTWNRYIPEKLLKPLFALGSPFVLKHHLAPFNQVRAKFHLPPFQSLFEAFVDGDCTLYTDSQALFPLPSLPAHHHFLGPVSWSPRIPLPAWHEEIKNRDCIYIALGSSGEQSLLPDVVRAVKDRGLVPVVAGGAASVQHAPPHCYVAEYLPGLEIASKARAMICNGGSLSLYQALSGGCPLLGLCSNIDQLMAMTWAAKSGAAFFLRTPAASPERIGQELDRVLSVHTKRQANKMSQCLAREDSQAKFCEVVQGLLPQRREASGA